MLSKAISSGHGLSGSSMGKPPKGGVIGPTKTGPGNSIPRAVVSHMKPPKAVPTVATGGKMKVGGMSRKGSISNVGGYK